MTLRYWSGREGQPLAAPCGTSTVVPLNTSDSFCCCAESSSSSSSSNPFEDCPSCGSTSLLQPTYTATVYYRPIGPTWIYVDTITITFNPDGCTWYGSGYLEAEGAFDIESLYWDEVAEEWKITLLEPVSLGGLYYTLTSYPSEDDPCDPLANSGDFTGSGPTYEWKVVLS